MNGIVNPDAISVGMVLQVPARASHRHNHRSRRPLKTQKRPPPTGPAPASTTNTSGFELGGQALSFSQVGHMKNARMTWVKRQVKWHGEPAGNFQHLIDSAHANGFKVLLRLSVIGEPGGIAGNAGGYYQNFANFLGGLARGGADAIEVWNEMNIDREWPSGLISGANYTQMLSAAYHAIKSNNSGTMVISGAPAPTGFFQGCSSNGGDDDCYMRQMAAAGAANVMDCVGIHYNAGIVPARRHQRRAGRQYGSLLLVLAADDEPVPQLLPRQAALRHRAGLFDGRRYWSAAEPVSPGHPATPWPSRQPGWLARSIALRGSGFVRMLIVWNVDATFFGADPQGGYAIVRPNGSCPSCDTLRGRHGWLIQKSQFSKKG